MDVHKVVEKLTEQDSYFEYIADKVFNIELKELHQSHASGEINEGIRAICKKLQQKYNILTYKTLTDEQAKAVFKKLKDKYPKLAEIEFIPLPSVPNDQYDNWHTKLLRQIRIWNVLSEKVVKAKATIIQINAYKAKAAKSKNAPAAKSEISKQEYKGNSVEFLSETDIEGQVANKLLNNIRKRSKDEAKDCFIEGEAGIKKARSL
jgi:hypothetical protein